MIEERELPAKCPYCNSLISFVVDPFSGPQSYVEDCEVCCRPIQVSYRPAFDSDDELGVDELDVRRLDG